MAGRQSGLGVPYPKGCLPPQQHNFLLLGISNSDAGEGEVPRSVPTNQPQGYRHLEQQHVQVNILKHYSMQCGWVD